MNCCDPTRTEPTGAVSPLLKQKQTESKFLTIWSTDNFKAAAALNILAPSMCRAILLEFSSLQIFTSFSSHSSGSTFPPHMLWVFSTMARDVCGSWQSLERIFLRNSFKQNVPSGLFLIVANWTPAICDAPPVGKISFNIYALIKINLFKGKLLINLFSLFFIDFWFVTTQLLYNILNKSQQLGFGDYNKWPPNESTIFSFN